MSETLQRNAELLPASLDDEKRTARLVWSTGAKVRRRDPLTGKPFYEALSLEPEHVDLSRLSGASLLNNHQQRDLRDVVGVVLNGGVDGKEGWAEVRFSDRGDVQPIWNDVKAGILRHVSVGYQVNRWTETRNGEGLVRTATSWVPYEISLVPCPADAGAGFRSKGEDMEATDTIEPQVKQAPAPDNAEQIRNIAKLAGLPASWADEAIGKGLTLDSARHEAFDALAKRSAGSFAPVAEVGRSYDDPQTRAAWLGEMLYANLTGSEPSEPAKQFSHVRSIHDVAAEALRLSGTRTTAWSAADLIARAMTTSDFPAALGNTVSRFVRAGYDAAPTALLTLASPRTVRDFKEAEFISVSGPGRLHVKREGGEIRYSHLDEHAEKATVRTYAVGLSLTREAMIDDDRGALTNIPQRLGWAAREEESLVAVELLTSNSGTGPVLADGELLFHSSHANVAGSGGAISESTLGAARLAMRKQTDSFGRRIGVQPSVLVVPPDLETVAQKQLSAIQASTTAEINPFSTLQLLVEPRLTNASRWYLIARNVEGLIHVTLEGRAGPVVDSETDFSTKNINFSILSDFTFGWVDHRGWYSNAGG
jgi:hypothetical protein